MKWNKNKENLLKAMADAGYSMTMAANELGFSKGAVSGKANRMGIRFGDRPSTKAKCPVPLSAILDDEADV